MKRSKGKKGAKKGIKNPLCERHGASEKRGIQWVINTKGRLISSRRTARPKGRSLPGKWSCKHSAPGRETQMNGEGQKGKNTVLEILRKNKRDKKRKQWVLTAPGFQIYIRNCWAVPRGGVGWDLDGGKNIHPLKLRSGTKELRTRGKLRAEEGN